LLKSKVISFWLTHSYLRRLGKFYPTHFKKMIEDLTDSYSQQKVMYKRYIDNEKFEAIAIDMNVDIRYVFSLHKKVIDKIIQQ
jgi:hypothetical protein